LPWMPEFKEPAAASSLAISIDVLARMPLSARVELNLERGFFVLAVGGGA
jgi:hypothetical protein